MSGRFKQAPPDVAKAARDGVSKYVPARRQINLDHTCKDCDRTAKWEVTADDERLYACDAHRREYAATALTYTEKRL